MACREDYEQWDRIEESLEQIKEKLGINEESDDIELESEENEGNEADNLEKEGF